MRTVHIRASVESDIDALKDRLREADEKEIIAAGNADGEEALRQSFTRSALRYTVDLDGIPVAMFGVVSDESRPDRGNVWFLGANEMSQIKKTFVRLSRHFIHEFLSQYNELWNLVDARYVMSVEWLKSCGAQFGPAIKFNGVDFLPFVLRRG